MASADYFLLVALMGFVTYTPRWFPLAILSQRQMPQWLIDWLDLIPVAILSALVFPDLLVSGVPRSLDLLSLKSLVAVPTLLVALKTRSLGATVMAGMLLYWAGGKLLQ